MFLYILFACILYLKLLLLLVSCINSIWNLFLFDSSRQLYMIKSTATVS